MASCVMGCIGANASDEKIKLASEYAYKLGLAFQIVDDILDVTSTQEELGKPIGSDSECFSCETNKGVQSSCG